MSLSSGRSAEQIIAECSADWKLHLRCWIGIYTGLDTHGWGASRVHHAAPRKRSARSLRNYKRPKLVENDEWQAALEW